MTDTPKPLANDDDALNTTTCFICEGTGEFHHRECAKCSGTGRVFWVDGRAYPYTPDGEKRAKRS